MTTPLILAVLQSPGALSGPDTRLNWLADQLARLGPSDLVVLPELFQCGYNIGDAIRTLAEPPDGAFAKAVQSLCKTHNTAVLYGYAERQGDTIYNAAQCFDATGHQLAHHRKLAIPPGFERSYFATGTSSDLFELKGVKIAPLICYDVEFPENLRHVAHAGAQLVVVLTALSENWAVVSEKLIPTRAFENGVYLCYANSCGTEGDLTYYGGSCIVGPTGQDIARAGADPETLRAKIEIAQVKAAQTRLPYLRDVTQIQRRTPANQ